MPRIPYATQLEEHFLKEDGTIHYTWIQTFIQTILAYERKPLLILSLFNLVKRYNKEHRGLTRIFRFTPLYDRDDFPIEHKTFVTLDINVEMLFDFIQINNNYFPNGIVSLGSGNGCYLEILMAGYSKVPILCLDKEIEKEEKAQYITKKPFNWKTQTLQDITDSNKYSGIMLCWPPADFHNTKESSWATIPKKIIQEICLYEHIIVIIDEWDSCGTDELWHSIRSSHTPFWYKNKESSDTQHCYVFLKN